MKLGLYKIPVKTRGCPEKQRDPPASFTYLVARQLLRPLGGPPTSNALVLAAGALPTLRARPQTLRANITKPAPPGLGFDAAILKGPKGPAPDAARLSPGRLSALLLPGTLGWWELVCISSSLNKRGRIFLPNCAGTDFSTKADNSKQLYPAAEASSA